MLPGVLLVLLTALVLWGLWSVARPRAAFVVQMVRGEARVARGTVTPGFVRDVREVCGTTRLKTARCAASPGTTASCSNSLTASLRPAGNNSETSG